MTSEAEENCVIFLPHKHHPGYYACIHLGRNIPHTLIKCSQTMQMFYFSPPKLHLVDNMVSFSKLCVTFFAVLSCRIASFFVLFITVLYKYAFNVDVIDISLNLQITNTVVKKLNIVRFAKMCHFCFHILII